MRTIKDIEAGIEERISEALKELGVPTHGLSPRVRICGQSRKKRQSASFEKSWSPGRDSIQITFGPGAERTPSSPQMSTSATADADSSSDPKSNAATHPLPDLIQALDHAESRPGFDFVALKWFRDSALPSEGFAWANPDSIREVLREAIESRLILTSKVPNPRSPQFPVTAIRLNRLMPEVKRILGSPDEAPHGFRPVSIRGEELSATVLRERR